MEDSMTMIPDRRSVLVTGAAVFGAVALPRASAAADEGLAPAADFTGKVRAFLSCGVSGGNSLGRRSLEMRISGGRPTWR